MAIIIALPNPDRPDRDNGWGLHDDGVSGPGTLPRIYGMLDGMNDRNMHWTTLLFNMTREKLDLIPYALDRDIMPIVRPYVQGPHPSVNITDEFATTIADYGCRYVQIWNEPNLASEVHRAYKEFKYDGCEDGVPAFAARLLDQIIRNANVIRNHAMIPLWPPMAPTGWTGPENIDHMELYRLLLQRAKNLGLLAEALEGCGLAIHNRPGGGQPLDKTGTCTFNNYNGIHALFVEFGWDMEMFGSESGYEDGNVQEWFENYGGNPSPSPQEKLDKHMWLNHEIFARFNPAHPKRWGPRLRCQNMWLAFDGPVSWRCSGWVGNQCAADGGPAPAWQYMWQLPTFTIDGTEPPPAPDPNPPPIPDPGPPAGPPEGIQYVGLTAEMIAGLRIAPAVHPELPHYVVTRVEVQPDSDSLNAYMITTPGDLTHGCLFWPGGEVYAEPKADPLAPPGARTWACSAGPMTAPWGPFGVRMVANSESLNGIGLYDGNPPNPLYKGHHPTLVTFELRTGGDTEPPADPPIQPPTDHIDALWSPAAAGNYGVGRPCAITHLVIHGTAKGAQYPCDADLWTAAINWFANPGSEVSAHYVVARDGTIAQCVREQDTAYHSGSLAMNQKSIGIEGEHCGEPGDVWTPACLASMVALARGVVAAYEIPVQNVLRHSDVVDTACPVNFPMPTFLAEVYEMPEITIDELMTNIYGASWTERWAAFKVSAERSQFFPKWEGTHWNGGFTSVAGFGSRVDWQLLPDLVIYWIDSDWQTPHVVTWAQVKPLILG